MNREQLLPETHSREHSLLLDILGTGDGHPVSWDGIDLDAFLKLTPARLYPLIFSRLQCSHIPDVLRAVIEPHYRRNGMLQLKRLADLRRIGTALTESGIGYLVLKGPVLAFTAYSDPAARTMIDLDLLVHDPDIGRAMSVLESIGYHVPGQFAGFAMEPGDAPPMVHRDPSSTTVELHSMLDSAPDDSELLAEVWTRARQVRLHDSVSVPTLGLEDFFAHVCTHLSRHHRFEGELRSLMDVSLLMGQPLDWEDAYTRWERAGIAPWIVLTATLAHLLLGPPLPEVFQRHPPSEGALVMAAEQLWVVEKNRVPATAIFSMAGRTPAPVHAHAPRREAPMPGGLAGLRARSERQLDRLRRLGRALRRGDLRRSRLDEQVDLFLKREQLFELVESERRSR